MNDYQGSSSEKQGVKFIPSTGSVIGGVRKEKTEWITDAIADLHLAINGLKTQLPGKSNELPTEDDSNQRVDAIGAFARTCSLFLRKTVLGNRDNRETRLLDDRVLELISLRFDRLRKIPRDSRREIEIGLGIAGGFMQATKLNDHTLEPEEVYHLRAGPQELKISIEWPLPGAADWTGIPSKKEPWLVSADQLFETSAGSSMNCNEWLGQVVVLFDEKGISLKEMIRTVANYEGAHSINVGRLSTPEGETASPAAKNPPPHILNAITVFGIRYADLIVIECALYLYEKLLNNNSITQPSGGIFNVKFGVGYPTKPTESSHKDWMAFRGGMMVSFSGAPQVIRHKIRAVN